MTSSPAAPVTSDIPCLYEGRQVNLRPVGREDARTLYQWRADLEAFHLLSVPEGVSTYEEFADQWELTLRRTITLLAVIPEDGRPSGLVQAYDINLADGWCFVASYVAPEHRSKRLGIEAGSAFWDYLFTQVNLRKIYMDVGEFNDGWLRAIPGLEAGLFQVEGRFRQHAWYEDRYWDVMRIAVHRERWLARRDFALQFYRLGAEPGSPARGAAPSRDAPPAPQGSAAPAPPGEVGRGRGKTQQPLPPRVDLVRRYLRLNREGAFDALLALLADDVVLTDPVNVPIAGTRDVGSALRFRHRMLSRALEAGASLQQISWLPAQEAGDSVTIAGSGSAGGKIELAWRFDAENRMKSIAIEAPQDLMAVYLLSGDLPLE